MPTKLNSLDLNGYKTFAKLTNLKFPAKITAIVGPNGSGKSNVADSIRWVLGEQSYSTLRAKRTEDMIYSGSDSRARAGMASVSISFNNENNWLPIDYAEVVLTRRAYRDGQNEYLINNQRVRLKDFHELLAKTGLSDRTYTIIGQGLVDLALSIKPDERRKLFEEAAGIGLYQTRKEEALKRLEVTQRNLERALDILDEIKPRLRSLERQAIKVGEYKTVQDNLQRNLREWYGFHWLKTQNEIDFIKKSLNQATEQARASQVELDQNKLEASQIRDQISSIRQEINGIHESLSELHNQSQARNQEVAILEERKHALIESQGQAEQEISRLEETIRADEAAKAQAQGECDGSQISLQQQRDSREKLLTLLNEARTVKQSMDQKRANSQAAIINAEKELIVLRSKMTESIERIEEMTKNIEAINSRKASLLEHVKVLEAKKAAAISAVKEQEKMLAENSQRQGKLTEELNQLRQVLENNHQQSNRLNLEKNKLASRLELLIQGQASLAGFSDGAKALMKINQQKSKRLHFSDLASKLNVPEKYEKAIVAALGEAVDVLVLRDSLIDEQFVDQYSTDISDRVAIIDHTESRESSIGELRIDPEVLGFAHELITTDDDYRAVINKLLGKTIVVDEIKTALRLRTSYRNFNFVSLSGELLLTNGLTLMGKTKGNNKVAYSRTVAEIEKSIKEFENELEKTAVIFAKTSQSIEDVNKHLAELTITQRTIESGLNDSRKNLNISSLDAEKSVSQLNSQENQRLQMAEQVDRQRNTLVGQQGQENTLKAKLAELQKNDLVIRNEQQSHNIVDIERAFQEIDAELKLTNQMISHHQSTMNTIDGHISLNKTRLGDFTNRRTNQMKQLEDINHQLTNSINAMELIHRQIEVLQQSDLSPKTDSLSELDKQNIKLAELDDLLRKDLFSKDRQVTHYQLELARQQEKLASLRTRIEDDFGLIEMEYRSEYESTKSTPLPFPDLVIESLPETKELPEGIDNDIRQQKAQIRRIGIVNLEAENEYLEVKERHNNLTTQISDLQAAISDIDGIVKELDEIMRKEFLVTFKAVSSEFTHMFTRLFNGGSARLVLSDESSPIEGGIEIEARLPGRREQGLVLLSGGERSLTAVALIFALLKVSPTPICVLDEVDAMLDESNVGRFIDLLKDLSAETQFLLITHNRNTVSAADVIYGVTMGKDSASQVISLKLDEIDDEYVK